ncbi:MAG: GNAT family N-acetyltransferase [Marinibacterium sp.]|nr:GNAT family N-acetyltransferase [Marinibacterium sp.]
MVDVIAVPAPEARVVALLERHEELMRAGSPPESCHVMAPDALWQAGALVFAVYDGDVALGVGAIKPIGDGEAEIKSMHTSAEARGRGVARAILDRLLAEASAQGFVRVSLETGSDAQFAPARALYARAGFEPCAPFGDYGPDPLSTFMTRPVQAVAGSAR